MFLVDLHDSERLSSMFGTSVEPWNQRLYYVLEQESAHDTEPNKKESSLSIYVAAIVHETMFPK